MDKYYIFGNRSIWCYRKLAGSNFSLLNGSDTFAFHLLNIWWTNFPSTFFLLFLFVTLSEENAAQKLHYYIFTMWNFHTFVPQNIIRETIRLVFSSFFFPGIFPLFTEMYNGSIFALMSWRPVNFQVDGNMTTTVLQTTAFTWKAI